MVVEFLTWRRRVVLLWGQSIGRRKGFEFVFGVEVGEKVGDDLDLLREGRG